jgi:hypothetical protein
MLHMSTSNCLIKTGEYMTKYNLLIAALCLVIGALFLASTPFLFAAPPHSNHVVLVVEENEPLPFSVTVGIRDSGPLKSS